MIMKIQLRQVLRNKRFLIFTIFVPVIWYIFIYNVQKGIVPNIMFGIAVFIGIIGNSMATFSKRISSNIDYSVKRYLLDQTIVQVVLNTLIFLVVLAVAVALFKFQITGELAIQFFLLTIMGIYFSMIGFVVGVRLEPKIIDTVSFPLIILAAMTVIPFASFGAEGSFMTIISKIQMIFPGYYYSEIINAISASKAIELKDLALFVGTFILNLIPLYFLVPKTKIIKSN